MTKQYFGTDGIRGEVGKAPITPDFVLHLGWAAGQVFAKQGRGQILIGKDTRISGYMFESLLEAGLVAAGVDVALLGPMPTPAIAYLTRTFSAKAGIVISASHNPYYDNGIKFFSGLGLKLSDDVEHEIESWLNQPIKSVPSKDLGKVVRIEDAAGRYIEHCKSTVPYGFNLNGLKIVVDCANGATYHIAPSVFRELGAEVVTIGVQPDGLNINKGVGSTDPAALCEKVLAERADLGIAFDGDGDRVAFVDHKGKVCDGDDLLFAIAAARYKEENFNGVVGTLMTNYGLEKALKDFGLEFSRANVGDRYVLEQMHKSGWPLGGENSGHIICGDITTTGDGIVAALQVLVACQTIGKPLADVTAGYEKYPQVMINVRHSGTVDIKADESVQAAVLKAEATLGDTGRVLLRASGTEPLMRVMVEGQDEALVQSLTEDIASTVRLAVE